MEKTVRILEQSALSTKKYTDKKTGQERVMNAAETNRRHRYLLG